VFVADRPLIQSMNWTDRLSTGALEMSRFHQFDVGNTWRPTRGSSRTGGAAARAEAITRIVSSRAVKTRLDTMNSWGSRDVPSADGKNLRETAVQRKLRGKTRVCPRSFVMKRDTRSRTGSRYFFFIFSASSLLTTS
jgi:hypothetical protein